MHMGKLTRFSKSQYKKMFLFSSTFAHILMFIEEHKSKASI